MEFLSQLSLSPAGTAAMAMMFMVIIYWVRNPERRADRDAREQS